MMRVALVYTGGTIGCTGTPLVPLPAAEFAARWQSEIAPLLPDDLEFVWKPYDPPFDSSQLQPSEWTRLARVAFEAAAEGADAAIILHGTDTMSGSAAALSYLSTVIDDVGQPASRLAMPIILTGSQRPLLDDRSGIREGTDAFRNISDAIAAAREVGPGIHLVFAGERLPGARARKMSTDADRAFACPNGPADLPPLPAADPAILLQQLGQIAPELGRRAVMAIGPSPNPPAALGAALAGAVSALADGLGAILLLGYGIGNLPAPNQLAPILKAARARGVLIAIGTLVPSGPVRPSLYGAGAWITEVGALPVGDMVLPASQAKLHVTVALAAARGWTTEQAEGFFQTPIAGERTF